MHAGNAALQTLAQLSVKKTLSQLSVKEYITAGFELVLSMLLIVSFFECPDESRRDEQELQTLYTMSWPPALLSAFIVYGHRVSPAYGPAPENFDSNLRRSRIFTWIYSLAFLIWDEDMSVKRGPALYVAAIFCFCDVVRFELEISGVMDDSEEDDELERLAAAVGALSTDQHGGAGSDATASKRGPLSDLHRLDSMSSNSMDSGVVGMQKLTKQHKLERLSTDSLSNDDFVEMITPAPSGGGSSSTGGRGGTTTPGTGLESLKTPSRAAASAAAPESPDRRQPSSRKPSAARQTDGAPVIYEF
ncbi:hypothetical protein PybrP1_003546 [[Pythium] brassicae (nom. inval.)]|nr:hypothetical protein PybrP1_003546 [[Pythium] brassicae (nom. inval.)]